MIVVQKLFRGKGEHSDGYPNIPLIEEICLSTCDVSILVVVSGINCRTQLFSPDFFHHQIPQNIQIIEQYLHFLETASWGEIKSTGNQIKSTGFKDWLNVYFIAEKPTIDIHCNYQHLQTGAKWFPNMSIHHPLGFNWHPFEGAGMYIYTIFLCLNSCIQSPSTDSFVDCLSEWCTHWQFDGLRQR